VSHVVLTEKHYRLPSSAIHAAVLPSPFSNFIFRFFPNVNLPRKERPRQMAD
jgi:hypothetical protein